MATQKTIKNEAVTSEPVVTNSIKTLTVVVVDEKSQPIDGANVSIKPSDASLVTNSSGEAQFTLGAATKYEITAADGGDRVTVPYYVTPNGATRLVVNPVYVKSVEAQLHPSSVLNIVGIIGSILALIIVGLLIWKKITKSSRVISKKKKEKDFEDLD